MAYIEELIKGIEDDISGKSQIYKSIKNDLTQEQIIKVNEKLKQIKISIKKAKREFDLEPDEFALSHIINVNCSFIWTTIEDLWSHKLEKSSGKINSQQKKENLDDILKQLYKHTIQLKNIVEK